MIKVSRLLTRQVRSVFRKLASKSSVNVPVVSLSGGSGGLRIRLHGTELLAEYHQASECTPAEVVIPLQAFADFEGRNDSMVSFQTLDSGKVQVSWEDAGVPQVRTYDAAGTKLPAFPAAPDLVPVEASLLFVLAQASQCVSSNDSRYATHNVQLKGSSGHIIATDGRQLLRRAHQLPWKEDILIPASSIYCAKELPHDGPVSLGKTDTHVVMQIGPWTLYLPIDKTGRFPDAANIVPKPEEAIAHCRIDTGDAEFLTKALAHLPGGSDEHAPVTLDLNGKFSIRARAEGQEQVVELLLARSEVNGKSARAALNRGFLARAIQLGVTDFHVFDSKKPLLFNDSTHEFVVMPLVDSAALINPSEHAVQITSTKEATTPMRRTKPVDESRTSGSVPEPVDTVDGTNGVADKAAKKRKPKNTGLAGLIEEAEALKTAQREILTRTHALVIALKRNRKQSRLVQSSLKALKDLQNIAA